MNRIQNSAIPANMAPSPSPVGMPQVVLPLANKALMPTISVMDWAT
ncbi:hypothetical protein ACWGR4_01505 [Embleya sp. NPDC055664]